MGAHVGSAAVQQYGCTALWSIANTTSKDNAVAI
eukprot:COSAG03_NODE_40527_length_101_cov_373.500000_1_plen_33_part_11